MNEWDFFYLLSADSFGLIWVWAREFHKRWWILNEKNHSISYLTDVESDNRFAFHSVDFTVLHIRRRARRMRLWTFLLMSFVKAIQSECDAIINATTDCRSFWCIAFFIWVWRKKSSPTFTCYVQYALYLYIMNKYEFFMFGRLLTSRKPLSYMKWREIRSRS